MEMTVKFPGGKKVDVDYGGFTIRTDQPKEDGGEGSAPSPFELFIASIAACAGYYALNFCLTRNLATDGMGISLKAERASDGKMIREIIIDVRPPKGFPKEYVPALQRSVESCTVKKHIQNPPQFLVRMAV